MSFNFCICFIYFHLYFLLFLGFLTATVISVTNLLNYCTATVDSYVFPMDLCSVPLDSGTIQCFPGTVTVGGRITKFLLSIVY